MILIFEGPDCCGKDTLISEWENKNGKADYYAHNGPYPSLEASYEAYHKQIDELAKLKFWEVGILNRSFISQVIYAPMLNGPEFLATREMVDEVQARLMGLGAFVIFCITPYEECSKLWKARIADELVKDEEQYRLIYEMYMNTFSGTKMNCHLYDYTDSLFRKDSRSKLSCITGGKLN